MPQFILGLAFGVLFAMCITYNIDRTSINIYQTLATGEELCAPHGGLGALDDSGDFTCVNYIVIHKPPSTNRGASK